MANKISEKLGLTRPMKEAVARFKELTKAEVEAEGKITPLVADGELELIAFRGAEIRRVCHNDEWWYCVTDVIGALVGADRASSQWTDLKTKLINDEGFYELSERIGKLPVPDSEGKKRPTEVATPETLFRIIQSISSPKVEPIKRWLAKVGYERIQEWQDPEIAIKRAILTYQIQGRSNDWIETRIRSIVARKELTSEWQQRGVQEGDQFAKLTNVISQATFGIPTQKHKMAKGLAKGHNLRDHMTNMELILTMLGETSTKEIAQQRDAQGFSENFHAAAAGGKIAGSARKQIEQETGRPVVSTQNFLGAARREADPERLTKKTAS